MVKPKTKHIDINSIFQELQNDFSSQDEGYIIMSHFGEFSQDLVNSLSEGLEYILQNKEAPKMITKRMFSIMIEGLQNIRLHGAKNRLGKQLGHAMIMESQGEYLVSFGNIINAEDKVVLANHLNKLNSMNASETKEFYLQTLSNGVISEKGGAGLGFITISLKSKSKINFKFVDFEENTSYFEMRVALMSN